MTEEQKVNIRNDIKRMIPDLARKNGVFNDEIENILANEYTADEDFVIVEWPEIQELMDKENFDLNSSLANDEWSLAKYGSSAYFVNKKWINNLK